MHVPIPPQSFNETAIQINVSSSGVAIMMKGLERPQLHCAGSRQLNWLGEILVSHFIRLFGAISPRCVGYAPTMPHRCFLLVDRRKLLCVRRKREIAPDHRTKHAKQPPFERACRKPFANRPRWHRTRNRFHTLALKVQCTRMPTGAVTT
jgi:hypothetical protein